MKTCKFCGAEILDTRRRCYCSWICARRAQLQQYREHNRRLWQEKICQNRIEKAVVTCAICGKEIGHDARRHYCSDECRSIGKRKSWLQNTQRYVARNPEKIREKSRRYYAAQPEKIREKSRRYYAKHRDEIKIRYIRRALYGDNV